MSAADEYSYMQPHPLQGYEQNIQAGQVPGAGRFHRMPVTLTFRPGPGVYPMQNVYAPQGPYCISPPSNMSVYPQFPQQPMPPFPYQATQVQVQYPPNVMPQQPTTPQGQYPPFMLSPVSPTYPFPQDMSPSPMSQAPQYCIPIVQERPQMNIPNMSPSYFTVSNDYESPPGPPAARVYYKTQPPEPVPMPPIPAPVLESHGKREKKIIQIINPQTGANIMEEMTGHQHHVQPMQSGAILLKGALEEKEVTSASVVDDCINESSRHQHNDIPSENIPAVYSSLHNESKLDTDLSVSLEIPASQTDLFGSKVIDVQADDTQQQCEAVDSDEETFEERSSSTDGMESDVYVMAEEQTDSQVLELCDNEPALVIDSLMERNDDLISYADQTLVEADVTQNEADSSVLMRSEQQQVAAFSSPEKHLSSPAEEFECDVMPKASQMTGPSDDDKGSASGISNPTAVDKFDCSLLAASANVEHDMGCTDDAETVLDAALTSPHAIPDQPIGVDTCDDLPQFDNQTSFTTTSVTVMWPSACYKQSESRAGNQQLYSDTGDKMDTVVRIDAVRADAGDRVVDEATEASPTVNTVVEQTENSVVGEFPPELVDSESSADSGPRELPNESDAVECVDSLVSAEVEQQFGIPAHAEFLLSADSLSLVHAGLPDALESGGRRLPLSIIAEECGVNVTSLMDNTPATEIGSGEEMPRIIKSEERHRAKSSELREPRRRPRRSSKDQNMMDDASLERASKISSPPPPQNAVDPRQSPLSPGTAQSLVTRSLSSEPCLTDMERRKNRLNSGRGESVGASSRGHHERHKTPSVEPVHRKQQTSVDAKSHELPSSRRYDREFLLGLQFTPEALSKPPGLPHMPDIILEKPLPPSRHAFLAQLASIPSSYSTIGVFPLPHKGFPEFQPAAAYTRSAMSAGSLMPRGRHHGSSAKVDPLPGRKVINVTLGQAVHLHTAENAWKAASLKQTAPTVSDAEQAVTEELYKRLRGILNKLTPQKFQTLIQQVNELTIDTEERLKGAIDIVFEKAISEPSYSVAYANMAKCLVNLKVPSTSNPCETITFRKLLLNRCQHEFETDQKQEGDIARMQIEIDNAKSDEQRRQLIEEKDHAELIARRRSLGNIRFIGELFKLKMLTENIMHDCVRRLLRAHDEDSLECLCHLLTTIGRDIDNEKMRNHVDHYFTKINSIIARQKISTRLKFMLQDVVELRNTCWVPRHDDNKPKMIHQIHSEAAAEEEQKTALLQRVSSSPAIGDRHSRQPRAAPSFEDPSKLSGSGRNASKSKLSRMVSDDGVHGRSGWQIGSGTGGGRRTPSVEAEKSSRFQSASGAREMALHSIEKDRSAAIAAVRSIAAGIHPTAAVSSSSSTAVAAAAAVDTDQVLNANHDVQQKSVEPTRTKHSSAELEKLQLTVLNDYLEVHSVQEAISGFRELDTGELMSEFVTLAVNHVIEKSPLARRLTGALLFQLIVTKLLTVEQLVDGLKEVFTNAEDIEIDVPKIWQYLAELICPMIQADGALPLIFLYQATESVRLSRKVSELVVSILKDATNRMGRSVVADLWRVSGLSWALFVPASEVGSFLKSCGLEWLEKSSSSRSRSDVHEQPHLSEDLVDRMHQQVISQSFEHEAVHDWMMQNFKPDEQKSMQFIRALVTAVCSVAVIDVGGHRYEVNKEELKRRTVLLSKCVGDDCQQQVQALFAIQSFVHRLQHPPDVLRNLFDVLYDEDVISEDAFNRWRTGSDPTEPAGKGIAVASVQRFFTWLNEGGSS